MTTDLLKIPHLVYHVNRFLIGRAVKHFHSVVRNMAMEKGKESVCKNYKNDLKTEEDVGQ